MNITKTLRGKEIVIKNNIQLNNIDQEFINSLPTPLQTEDASKTIYNLSNIARSGIITGLFLFATTDTVFSHCFNSSNLHLIYNLGGKFGEVNAYLTNLKRLKSQRYSDLALTTLLPSSDGLPYPDYYYTHDNEGNNTGTLSSAGISLLKAQSAAYASLGAILERGKINTQDNITINNIVETRKIEINLKEIMKRDISELAEYEEID